jgi:ABC-2 type transport system permease protein
VLSQPIYRDALLIGKFLGGLVTLAVALTALFLIVFGAGLLLLGVPPRGPEVVRGIAFLLVAIAYGGVWLAVAILFSVIFRSTATSALCSLGLWLFFFLLWPMIAQAITTGFMPAQFRSVDEVLSLEEFSSALQRLSPGTLLAQTRGMIPGTPLPFDQSLLLIWPQITGLIAGMIVVFSIAYIVFQREEVRA